MEPLLRRRGRAVPHHQVRGMFDCWWEGGLCLSSGCGLWLKRVLVFGGADQQRGGAAVAGGGGGAAHDGGRGEPDAGDRAAHEHAACRPGGAGHHPRRYRRSVE